MRHMAESWAVVMAGGDGARLRNMTTTGEGVVIPKQFCSLGRSECLLQDAVKRAQSIVSPAHVCSVVAAQHQRWWTSALSSLNHSNIFVQPDNKGTGFGILLALLQLERINSAAVVTLLPADHYFKNETPVIRTLRSAANMASADPSAIYVLGVEPEGPDSELGYILPVEPVRRSAARVVGFTEKPEASYARELLRLGALWNLFILVGGVGTFLELFEESHSREIEGMRAALNRQIAGDFDALKDFYQTLTAFDFSREILELQAERLHVLRVARCGWTDLGTPQRVQATVRQLSSGLGIFRKSFGAPPLFFDLSATTT